MLVGRVPGATVVLTPAGAVAGVDTRGAPWGTRELDLLDPSTLVQRVHAIVLADDLASVGGVVRWLAERHHGFPVGTRAGEVVPIVPAAAVGSGGDDVGYQACEAAVAAAGAVVPDAIVVVGQTAAALVVVDAELDKAGCRRVAMSAHDGLVRAGVRLPATVFALATGNPTGTGLDDLCTAAANAVLDSATRR
ncbi:L-aminopeptidase/D-esterase-like protein [Saccharothrix tamanrassetensis]|uniref:L-aminopeptidase/D-esterase-like protein n=1 Tax=Saccharothrix tamanrassetensis TaxID=1051531 RepID=A0A841CKE8_9PSEU|nr:peptidase S58, DmpA [Saccharothrix tamanrassetensis]MBB5957530.1 L-aminopeptidase/D-esterase-like protein [Saccharothrix tamanrassetensis]